MRDSWIKLALLGLLGLTAWQLAPTGVSAGNKLNNPVTLTATSMYGSLGSARNSANAVEHIGCSTTGGTALCSARNAAGTTASCSTNNAFMVQQVVGLNPMSEVYVTFSNGSCTGMNISTRSNAAVPVN